MPRLSIFQKIVATILLGAMVAVVSMSLLTYFSTRQLLEEVIADKQLLIAQEMMDKIDLAMYQRYVDIEFIARDSHVESFMNTTFASEEERKKALDTLQNDLSEVLLLTGPWDAMQLLTPQRKVVFSSEGRVGYTLPRNEYFDATIDAALGGRAHMSDIFLNGQTQKPTMLVAYPIRDPENKEKITGVALGDVTMSGIFEILNETPVASVELFNEEGLEIADNDMGTDEDEPFLSDMSYAAAIQLAIKEDTGSAILPGVGDATEGASALISFVRERGYKSFPGHNWMLFIETPETEAFGEARTAALSIPVVFIPIVLLIVFAVLWTFRTLVVEPILALTAVAMSYASGDFKKRATVHSEDEMGTLGKTFNTMADKLDEMYGSLGNKVEEKTQELSKRVEDAEKLNKIIVDRELKMIELKEEIKKLKGTHI